MAHAYSHLYNLPTTGLRFFTVYGPWVGQIWHCLSLPKLFLLAILFKSLIMVSIGGFTYIEDIIEGILRILDRPVSGNTRGMVIYQIRTSLAPWRIYNIGNNQPVELLEYVRAIEDSIGKRAVIELLPIQPGDVPDTHANVEDLINQFDHKPATTIEDGVKLFVGLVP